MNQKRARQIRKMVYASGSHRDRLYYQDRIEKGRKKGFLKTKEIYCDLRRRYYKALKKISYNVRAERDVRWIIRAGAAWRAIKQAIPKVKNKEERTKFEAVIWPFNWPTKPEKSEALS